MVEQIIEPKNVQIPDRLFFKIGDVSKITGLEPYVVGYWETGFEILSPEMSNKNLIVYNQVDVRKILLIKQLLYNERYSIEGAKKRLKEIRVEKKEVRRNSIINEKELKDLRSRVHDLLKFVKSTSPVVEN